MYLLHFYFLYLYMTINKILLNWYYQHKRELPFRNTHDPYKIWLSEIILQQTRMEQGLPYYYAFVKKYPTIQLLAKAPLDQVLKLWQGLGYYNRARHLHEAANFILKNYQGKFPGTYKEILQLKGIGKYTAAAIASSAFNEPVHLLDGNVIRWITRFYGLSEPVNTSRAISLIEDKVKKLLNKDNPRDHNQAMIEFGALQCIPNNPDCDNCLLSFKCIAYKKQLIDKLPVKIPAKKSVKRYFNYFIIISDNMVYLQKRTAKDIWKELYEYPLLETPKKLSFAKLAAENPEFFKNIPNYSLLHNVKYKHQLSHQTIFAHFYFIKTKNVILKKNWVSVKVDAIQNYPIPRLLEKTLSVTCRFLSKNG